MARFVFRSEMPPLESINRPQVAFLAILKPSLVQELSIAVPVPDTNVLLLQLLGIRAAADKPQQFFGNTPPEGLLRGQQGKCVVPQIEPHLCTKERQSAGACTVWPFCSCIENKVYRPKNPDSFLTYMGKKKYLPLAIICRMRSRYWFSSCSRTLPFPLVFFALVESILIANI